MKDLGNTNKRFMQTSISKLLSAETNQWARRLLFAQIRIQELMAVYVCEPVAIKRMYQLHALSQLYNESDVKFS